VGSKTKLHVSSIHLRRSVLALRISLSIHNVSLSVDKLLLASIYPSSLVDKVCRRQICSRSRYALRTSSATTARGPAACYRPTSRRM